MKQFIKRGLKTILVFIISTIVIYVGFTAKDFYKTCKENQLYLFENKYNEDIAKLDKDKIKELGDSVELYKEILEQSANESKYKDDGQEHYIGDGHEHSLGEFYDPLGFSIWSFIQVELTQITTKYINISIISGVAIAIAYLVITCRRISTILKFIIGYFGIMIVVPPIYMYTWTYRFWDIGSTYSRPKYFYIGYTAIFVIMYIVNYKIGVKMTEELNQNIKNN